MKLDASFSFSSQLQQNLVANDSTKLVEFQTKNPMLMASSNPYLLGNNLRSNSEEKIECQSVTFEEIAKEIPVPLLLNTDLDTEVKECRTWEMLGCLEEQKLSQFILESNIAIKHLDNFKNWPLVAYKVKENVKNVIEMKEFMESMKLVLLGIESDCFWWCSKVGYIFRVNTSIAGVSNEAIKDICTEITHWSTCFKLLSILVNANPDSVDKSHQDGLILRAMCSNVADVLLHYQAGIIQVFNESLELLNLLHKLRPLGELISEVARLCKCNNTMETTLGEGTGILSHIYKQVTQITKPNIALVYYSVLKSCCEIYFQMLEKWIFEGACDETHGEFMIKIRSQYLRYRGHKFWSKCFGIYRESVPGFLDNLTESILRCGKTVRLLKICDPKNSLCNLFVTSRPSVKVCLNVNMLLRQEEICQDYLNRGIDALGDNVTLKSALEQLKIDEKEKIKQVTFAQQGFLDRIKKSQIEKKILLAKNKQELLADLKYQAEAAVLRKEKAKEAKMLEEKFWMEKAAAEEEEAKNLRLAEIKQTVEFYKELAIEANSRRLRATWRATRMSLFDKRVDAIIAERHDEIMLELNDNNCPEEIPVTIDDNSCVLKDDNSNEPATDEINKNSETAGTSTRTPRPTDLPVKSTSDIPHESKISNVPSTTEISEILTEISENNRRLTLLENKNHNKTQDKNESIVVVVDEEGNEEENIGLNNSKNMINDENKNNSLPNDNEIIKNIENLDNNVLNSEHIVKMTQSIVNDLNDFTPMSCTTDSYVPSTSSVFYNYEIGSCSDSKNDFESPMTPGDCLTKSNLKNTTIPTSQSFFSGIGFDRSTSVTFDSSLTMADVELIDNASLQICLKKSVIIPLVVQSSLANSALIKYLLQEHNILSHLQSLRSFFFLLNGEFARNLSASLFKKFYEISMPVELFNSATLTNLLENALHSSLNCSYKNSDLLTLSAIEVPARLQVSNPEALECLCLNYKVSWPLNIILDELSMQQYSKVFKFLLMVGRVLWVLQDDFCLLKIDKKATMSAQYHKVQLYRHAMMQFMTAFSNYLTCSVLHASWTEFEKDLETSRTLDDIYTTHVNYINKIRSRCILTSKAKKLRECLISIFKIILQFHNCLRSHEWHKTSVGYTHSNYAKLEKMYKAFCELRTYPAIVVEKLADSGYQSHLTHFLDALNINPLYNLSTNAVTND